MAQSAPSPASILFARGVIARLEVWPTLKVAVQENWGGPCSAQKRSWLASELVDQFETTNPPPDDQYVEEMLLQVLSDEFDVELEDGSAEVVAKDLVKLWEETQSGKAEGVAKWEADADKARGKKVDFQAEGESGDEDEGEWESDDGEGDVEMADEAPQLIQPPRREEPEVDEDGFTMVKSKTKRR